MRTLSSDIVIIGSGFAGSIMAMCLKRIGYNVTLIEKNVHPRFAIGESSTPIADMILRDLSKKYQLPVLWNLSRYGSWQKNYPEVHCGLKRGFSYYHHRQGERFEGDSNHTHELHVAASSNDINSDTNWFREETDHFLVNEAVKLGANLFQTTEVLQLKRIESEGNWQVIIKTDNERIKITTNWILDCSGSDKFAQKFLHVSSSTDDFHTNTSAIYSHFEDTGTWLEYLTENGFSTKDYPYNPDHSALHHIIKEGWLWMLRFNNNILSSGLVLDNNKNPDFNIDINNWKRIIDSYPSLRDLFNRSKLTDIPGKIIKTNRLQRKLSNVYGEGWFALPHTATFVDPLHSTGIAFTLSGIEYLLSFFDQKRENKDFLEFAERYQNKIFTESEWIDSLVSIAYKSMRNEKLFNTSVMLYFIATVHHENNRYKGSQPGYYLSADNTRMKQTIHECVVLIRLGLDNKSHNIEIDNIVKQIREKTIEYNVAGLLDSRKNNIYTHTAAILD